MTDTDLVCKCGRPTRDGRSFCETCADNLAYALGGVDPEAVLQRVTAHVEVREMGHGTPCWMSTYARDKQGYTRIRIGSGPTRESAVTHRVAYQLHVGPIPAGLTIDHLCRVTTCCNPSHLEPVTIGENVLRGTSPLAMKARQTHCHKGHEFTEQNTRRDKYGKRICRACDREYHRLAYAKKKEKAA